MNYNYEQWLFSDKVGKEVIMRSLFERIEQLENDISQLQFERQPLKRLSHSAKSLNTMIKLSQQ